MAGRFGWLFSCCAVLRLRSRSRTRRQNHTTKRHGLLGQAYHNSMIYLFCTPRVFLPPAACVLDALKMVYGGLMRGDGVTMAQRVTLWMRGQAHLASSEGRNALGKQKASQVQLRNRTYSWYPRLKCACVAATSEAKGAPRGCTK